MKRVLCLFKGHVPREHRHYDMGDPDGCYVSERCERCNATLSEERYESFVPQWLQQAERKAHEEAMREPEGELGPRDVTTHESMLGIVRHWCKACGERVYSRKNGTYTHAFGHCTLGVKR